MKRVILIFFGLCYVAGGFAAIDIAQRWIERSAVPKMVQGEPDVR